MPMNRDPVSELTPRQREVLELLSQRASHKEIARRLDISVGRVSQYVRSLKDKFDAQTLGELVAAYRVLGSDSATNTPCNFSLSRDFKLPDEQALAHQGPEADVGRLHFEDAQQTWPSEWAGLQSPEQESSDRSVSRVLDGKHGTFFRVGYMIAVAFGTMLVVLTGITMATALSDLMTSYG